jgi:hypothetical protein
MLHQLADYQAMYAVMKFRAFENQQLVELLERKVQAYRATERFWDGWGAQVRAELFRLDAENKALRRQLAAGERAIADGASAPVPASWWQRLRARFSHRAAESLPDEIPCATEGAADDPTARRARHSPR